MTASGHSERLWQMERSLLIIVELNIVCGPKDHPAEMKKTFRFLSYFTNSISHVLLIRNGMKVSWPPWTPAGWGGTGVQRGRREAGTQLKCNAVARRVQLLQCEVRREHNPASSRARWTHGCALWWEGNVVILHILHRIRNSPWEEGCEWGTARCNTDLEKRWLHLTKEKKDNLSLWWTHSLHGKAILPFPK